jgi:hypothetical protein
MVKVKGGTLDTGMSGVFNQVQDGVQHRGASDYYQNILSNQ